MDTEPRITAFEHTLIVIFSFIFFAALGFVACLLLGRLGILSNESFMLEAVPMMLGFGIVAAVLAYRHPRVFSVVLWFFP